MQLETAIDFDRNNARAIFQLGHTLRSLGQPRAAIPHFEKALRLNSRDPNIGSLYFGFGQCLLLLRQVNEAIDLLRKARAGNPRLWFFHLWLAGALGLSGDLDEARSALTEAIRLRPEVHSLARLLAHCPDYSNPRHWALCDKTLNIGLRRAGMPD